jgi:hypothetical protein
VRIEEHAFKGGVAASPDTRNSVVTSERNPARANEVSHHLARIAIEADFYGGDFIHDFG